MPHRIPIDRLLGELPAELQLLLQAPFPAVAATPNSSFSWEEWQAWFADAPGRLVHPIADGYRDYESDDEDPIADFDVAWSGLDEQYRAMAGRCVAVLEAALGPARLLSVRDLWSLSMPGLYTPDHPGFERDLPPPLRDFDALLTCIDRTDVAWWRVAGRLVLLHHIGAKGDGDVHFSIALVVLAGDGEAGA